MNRKIRTELKVGGIVLVVVVLLVLFRVLFLTSIPVNHVAVKYNAITGEIAEKPSASGWRLKKPFVDEYYPVGVYTHALHLKPSVDVEGNHFDGTISIQTKDGQWIKVEAEVLYRITKEHAVKFFKTFRDTENLRAKMPAIVQRALEKVSSDYDIVETLGEKRKDVQKDMEVSLKDELKKYNIELDGFTLIDTDAGDAIEKAIADEAVAQQQIKTTKQKQENAKIENATRLEKAKTDAEEEKIKAQGVADANKTLSQSITPEILKMEEMKARQKHGWIEVITNGQPIVDTTTKDTKTDAPAEQ